MPKITVAKTAGFCFGVKRAMNMAWNELEESENGIYALGPLIHNKQAVSVYEDKGLMTVNNLDEIRTSEVEELVFWTPNGKTYHTKNTCRSLSRSKIINSGTVYESGKDFKCENCK